MTSEAEQGVAGAGSLATPASGQERLHGPRSPTILVLAVSCGLCVANLYYIQPILPVMAASLHTTPQSLAPAVSSTQLGYALGLFALVPLGDVTDRRRLLTMLMTATAVVLAVIPLTSGIILVAMFFLLGLVTVSAMVVVPQAANMALPQQRGQVLGTVMTGLILGALLCRTFAGTLGDLTSWRMVYWVAAVLIVVACLLLRRILPRQPAVERISVRQYLALLVSLASLVRHSPIVVERALYGALGFAMFSAFWTALPLRLAAAPYYYSATAIGVLGLLGAAGALGASLAGRLADRGRQQAVTAAAFTIIFVSFAVASVYSTPIIILALATLLIDFAVQGAHIINQTTVFAHVDNSMRSRVTTIYMTAYFLGGAAGSGAASVAWAHGGWSAVGQLGAGAALCALLLLLGYTIFRRRHQPRIPTTEH